jgi:hypothetical protein
MIVPWMLKKTTKTAAHIHSSAGKATLPRGSHMKEKNSPDAGRPEASAGETEQEFMPPLDFSSIVLPIFTHALLKLGLLGDPDKGPEPKLDLARRLIDILDLLKDRTKGNLSPEEENFLDSCLQQLKAGYLQKSRFINP